jgi:hypothetical protein
LIQVARGAVEVTDSGQRGPLPFDQEVPLVAILLKPFETATQSGGWFNMPEYMWELMATLNERHGAPWMVEVTAAALYFAMVAGVANAFEVAPPPDGDKLPA